MSLLIHSMSEFSDLVLGALDIAEARNLVEVGAEFGGMSALLADYAADRGGTLTSIDPSVKPEFAEWLKSRPAVRHIASPSLDVLHDLPAADAWVIDGDHNYYTVYHELKAVGASCRRDGKPLLAFLHDVNWPCGRRDSYYAPDRIPADWRHPYDYEGGVTLHSPDLLPNQGFRGCGQFAWARHEGGPRNGVLTAVEDFVEEQRADGAGLAFAFVPAVFGLGILFATDAPWSQALAAAVIPHHDSKLLHSLEVNRLVNYLKVIEIQDGLAAAALPQAA